MQQEKSVLIVEDEGLIRGLCCDVFVEAGFTVLEAQNADEALTVLETRADVSAVVTDVRMPGKMDGLKLSREVNSRWPGVPVVITSGHLQIGDTDLPSNSSFVPKPYKFLELVREVNARITLGR